MFHRYLKKNWMPPAARRLTGTAMTNRILLSGLLLLCTLSPPQEYIRTTSKRSIGLVRFSLKNDYLIIRRPLPNSSLNQKTQKEVHIFSTNKHVVFCLSFPER